MNHGQPDHREDIARQDRKREPAWQGVEMGVGEGEHDDGGDEQEFVRQGIQDRPEFTALVEPARDESVDSIQQGGGAEHDHAGHPGPGLAGVPVFEHEIDEGWDQQDPQRRHLVGRGHHDRPSD